MRCGKGWAPCAPGQPQPRNPNQDANHDQEETEPRAVRPGRMGPLGHVAPLGGYMVPLGASVKAAAACALWLVATTAQADVCVQLAQAQDRYAGVIGEVAAQAVDCRARGCPALPTMEMVRQLLVAHDGLKHFDSDAVRELDAQCGTKLAAVPASLLMAAEMLVGAAMDAERRQPRAQAWTMDQGALNAPTTRS